MAVLWFKDFFLEFELAFKGLYVVRVVSNVEEVLLFFAFVMKLFWRRWRRCDCFLVVVHYFYFYLIYNKVII